MGHQPLDDSQRTTGIGPMSTLALRAPPSTGGLSWDGNRTQYSYDAYGRRVRSKRPVGLQLRTVKHYLLPDGRPYLDRPTGPKPTPPEWSYAYLGDRLLARFDNAGKIEHVVTDHIGYPMATISYTGTVQWQPDPEPFGDVISEQSVGPGHDPLIRYPGQWRVDPVPATTEPTFTTLYYNTHRWYNPSWGRYTQADPVSLLGATNLYAYAWNSPFRVVDPLGLRARPDRAEWCSRFLGPGDWAPDPCKCDQMAVARHHDNATVLRDAFCREANAGSDRRPRETEGGITIGGVDRIARLAWYVPQGDPCVDFCICVHEWGHLLDQDDERVNRIDTSYEDAANHLECNAYGTQVNCLLRMKGR